MFRTRFDLVLLLPIALFAVAFLAIPLVELVGVAGSGSSGSQRRL
jgi:hypothetical protein